VTPKPTWVDGRVDALLAALHDLGMSASRAAAAELVAERVGWVSSQMRISPAAARRYLTDDAMTSLARTMVISVADETPGADILESARTAARYRSRSSAAASAVSPRPSRSGFANSRTSSTYAPPSRSSPKRCPPSAR
jgi:hypothetical protein